MRHHQIDEYLVVAVTAAYRSPGRRLADAAERVEMRQQTGRGQTLCPQPGVDLRIAEHTLELRAHRVRRDPQRRCARQIAVQATRRRILKHQQIQNDIGVEHQHCARMLLASGKRPR